MRTIAIPQPSQFAKAYEAWYTTPFGRYADRLEKNLILTLLPEVNRKLILDVGCGTGNYSFMLSRMGARALGVLGVILVRALMGRRIKPTWLLQQILGWWETKLAQGTTQTPELNALLEGAKSFHSHSGPFLALGLKAGLTALRELGSRKGDPDLRAEVKLPYRIPISCLLDGVQYSTGCTVGNKRLCFKDSTDITLTFLRDDKAVELTLRKVSFELLRRLFRGEHLSDEELRDLSHNIATMNESELFDMKQQPVDSATNTLNHREAR